MARNALASAKLPLTSGGLIGYGARQPNSSNSKTAAFAQALIQHGRLEGREFAALMRAVASPVRAKYGFKGARRRHA
jgi:hypothetical protein